MKRIPVRTLKLFSHC